MAGLLYLPRIFVYHVENSEKKEATSIFETMERRLYFYIMRPAMIATWLFGVILIYINGLDVFSQLWMHLKLALVIFLSIYHEYLGICLKSLESHLKKISDLLKKDGYLYICATPNGNSPSFKIYRERWNLFHPVQHLTTPL